MRRRSFLRISFDIDGVLGDFAENAAKVANSIWPNKVPEGYAPNHWDWPDIFTKAEWDIVWDEIKKIPDFWVRQAAYEKNIQELQEFLKTSPDTRLFFITARIGTGGVSARKQTAEWLQKFDLWPRGKLSTVLVSRPEEKINLMQEARVGFSVDDKKETVAACRQLPKHQAYLFSQPWNQDADLPRVYSVREYLEITAKVPQPA